MTLLEEPVQPGDLYSLHSGLMAVTEDQGLVKISPGAVIRVTDTPLEKTLFVDAIWQDRKIMLFKGDLEQRGTLVKTAKASASRSSIPLLPKAHNTA